MSELNQYEQSIVDRLRYGLQHNQSVTLGADEVHIPMNALIERGNRRTQPENEPLTLDELRQMDGEPVWVQELPPYTTAGYKVLAAPAVNEYGDICFDGGDCYAPYDYGKTWLAYHTKPERSEGE